MQSDSLEVRVDLNTCALTYKDARTGKVLLSERQDMPREAEKTYMETSFTTRIAGESRKRPTERRK